MANKLLRSVTAVALASAALASSPAAAQNRQQKAQAAGDYGTINDSYMDPVGAIQNAWNNPGANKAPNQETPGYNRIEYRPDRVIPLWLREDMKPTIVFPAYQFIEIVVASYPDSFEAYLTSSNLLWFRKGFLREK